MQPGRSGMHQLACVFFDVSAMDSYFLAIDGEMSAQADRLRVLRNLVAFGQIRVKVVLAIELSGLRDFAVQGNPGFNGELDYLAVENRENSRHSQTNRTNMIVGIAAKICGA